LRGQKKKPSRQSGEIDSRAAALILQDFVDERQLRESLPEFNGEAEEA
jgi:RNase H-fold protein (predicted Holliday junction resolvase)